jgi:hypothetical protein
MRDLTGTYWKVGGKNIGTFYFKVIKAKPLKVKDLYREGNAWIIQWNTGVMDWDFGSIILTHQEITEAEYKLATIK